MPKNQQRHLCFTYLMVSTATNVKRIARCWHRQHLAHKAGHTVVITQ